MEEQAIPELTASEVDSFLKEGRGVLLDTLVPEHYEARRIPGAANACVFEMIFLDHVAGAVPDKDTPVVVYGAGEGALDCQTAAEKLVQAGYTDVSVFHGGLAEWHSSGLPLEGKSPDELEPPHPKLVLESKTYKLLPQESVIKWTGRKANGAHEGTLRLIRGEMDATAPKSASFILDMNSIRNTDLEGDETQSVLEAHLRSDDFFFTRLFPEASFSTTEIKIDEDAEVTLPNATISGELTLRGLSKEIVFSAQIRNIADDKVSLMGNFDFDRTDWGIVYGSSRFFRHLGYHVVFDLISVDFMLVLE